MHYYSGSKYKAVKTTCCHGHEHDSIKEAQRCNELHLLARCGEISDLEQQRKYTLIPAQFEPSTEVYTKGKRKGELKKGKLLEKECSYFADFVYKDKDGNVIVEDTKGMKTQAYIIKRKLMLKIYGIRINEI